MFQLIDLYNEGLNCKSVSETWTSRVLGILLGTVRSHEEKKGVLFFAQEKDHVEKLEVLYEIIHRQLMGLAEFISLNKVREDYIAKNEESLETIISWLESNIDPTKINISISRKSMAKHIYKITFNIDEITLDSVNEDFKQAIFEMRNKIQDYLYFNKNRGEPQK